MTTTNIDYSDFRDIFDLVIKRYKQWCEELQEGGWRGKVSLLIEGEEDYEGDWIAPHVGAGFSLERSVGDHDPIKYDPELEYPEGIYDENYPANQIHEILMTYTGTHPYWINMIMKIHPDEEVKLSIIS